MWKCRKIISVDDEYPKEAKQPRLAPRRNIAGGPSSVHRNRQSPSRSSPPRQKSSPPSHQRPADLVPRPLLPASELRRENETVRNTSAGRGYRPQSSRSPPSRKRPPSLMSLPESSRENEGVSITAMNFCLNLNRKWVWKSIFVWFRPWANWSNISTILILAKRLNCRRRKRYWIYTETNQTNNKVGIIFNLVKLRKLLSFRVPILSPDLSDPAPKWFTNSFVMNYCNSN